MEPVRVGGAVCGGPTTNQRGEKAVRSLSRPFCPACGQVMLFRGDGLWGCDCGGYASDEEPDEPRERRTECVRALVTKSEMEEIRRVVPRGGWSSFAREAILEKLDRMTDGSSS